MHLRAALPLLLAAADTVTAQCILPPLPPNTQFVLGQDDACQEGGDMPGDGSEPEQCTIQCVTGFAQGGAGDYDYECNGDTLEEPVPACTECDAGEYNSQPGAATCTPCEVGSYNADTGQDECLPCPDGASTDGGGSEELTDCRCEPGHTGNIEDPGDECVECPADFYKTEPGPVPAICTPCPDFSSTDESTGSTALSNCLCIAGHSGELNVPADDCEPCELGLYKGDIGPEDCTTCPAGSTTLFIGSTSVEECECDLGYTGEITSPAQQCDACGTGEWKGTVDSADCTVCTDGATTEEEASTSITACLCAAGFTGEIETEDDECSTCEINFWKDSIGPAECTACPPNSNTGVEEGSTAPNACIWSAPHQALLPP